MSYLSYDLEEARKEMLSAALHLAATELGGDETHADYAASCEHRQDWLATAARGLYLATEALPRDDRPVGWNTKPRNERIPVMLTAGELDQLLEAMKVREEVQAITDSTLIQRLQQERHVFDWYQEPPAEGRLPLTIDWELIADLTRWHVTDPTDPTNRHPMTMNYAMQLLKLAEEVGEVATANTPDECIAELCDVALTALVAVEWAADPKATYVATKDDVLVDHHGNALTLTGALGLVTESFGGYLGYNERKGVTHDAQQVAQTICRLVHVAFEHLAQLTSHPERAFAEHLVRVHARSASLVGSSTGRSPARGLADRLPSIPPRPEPRR